MNEEDFLNYVITPTTTSIGLRSLASDRLLLGTALIETELEFLEQKGPGKGLGVYSIESNTHRDIQRYLNRYDKARLKEACISTCFYVSYPSDDALIHNLRYATVIARLKYYMQAEPLPDSNDAEGLAKYHKRYYNSAKGATNVLQSVNVFKRIINEQK